jgi:hypothetical protein
LAAALRLPVVAAVAARAPAGVVVVVLTRLIVALVPSIELS